jgi:transglutaminase-like putative cysteine protease
MTFAREHRRILGWLALIAPIPLPFNQVLEWPLLFLYSLVVIYFLQRTEEESFPTLPKWSLNLLGLLYLPFLFVDLQLTFQRNSPVKALLHLVLFLVLVKLFSLRQEREVWHVLVAIFFLFIGAMATSSHVTIGLYLVAFLLAMMLALARLVQLHLAARFGARRSAETPPRLAFRGPLFAGTVLVLLVAVPLFAAMPRFREPFVFGGGTGIAGIGRTTGFSDSVDLSLTSSIRGNRNVVARIEYGSEVANPQDLRFKAASFDYYRNRRWFRQQELAQRLAPEDGNHFLLRPPNPNETLREAQLFLEPIGSRSLVLPSETVRLDLDFFPVIDLDPGGAVLLPVARRRDTLRYKVALADGSVISAVRTLDPEHALSALDLEDLSPRIAELAIQVMGEGSPEEKVDRLEQHLLTQYTYTTDLLGRDGQQPLEEFLFTYQSGHCELFATSMVLMLRSQGIPARFVTGFLGAEHNPLQDYYILRQQNAHAWVEAFTPERGWRVYDPTPPEGRPAVARRSLKLFFTQLVDFVTFRWDRYVLTYGADDQKSFFEGIKEKLESWWLLLREGSDAGDGQELEQGPGVTPGDRLEGTGSAGQHLGAPQLVAAVLLMAALLGFIAWQRFQRFDAVSAWHRLRHDLARSGLPLDESTPPLALAERARTRFPSLSGPVTELVELYLRQSFAEQILKPEERTRLWRLSKELRTGLRRALRET